MAGISNIYLKIGDVKGESQDKAHAEEIDVLGWTWGMTQSGRLRVGGQSTAKANVKDLTIRKWLDRATPPLVSNCLKGSNFKQAVLVERKSGGEMIEFLKIALADVVVSAVSWGERDQAGMMVETVTLNFKKFEITYWPQKRDGSPDAPVTAQWNVEANAPA